ncbi:uncharacterized protein [Ptychodera flava]|uniref:uncharacterized protein isoform X2 n=1 Tax=Ptychodera flava TaxID=63121 RepID=UPI003969E3B2
MADIKEVERYKYLDQVFTPGKKTSDVKDIYDKWSATYDKLQKLGYHNIDGVDLSEKSLEIARKKAVYKYLTCAVLGPHRLEGVGENSYDAIVSSGCFVCDGHLNDSVLKEWTRIVKPGGYIVIAVNARYIGLCEGDTYKMLIADKRMELVKRQSIDRFTWDHKTQQYMSGFVYSLKVLA